ncbi:MAG: hypothetical protein HFJ34_05735 [Clostridia bacterium]|nr:hypothetical protein [Clostridia bacterium]
MYYLATLSTGATSHEKVDEVAQEKEYNIDNEKRDHFADSLKVIVNNEEIQEEVNEKIVDEIIKKRR